MEKSLKALYSEVFRLFNKIIDVEDFIKKSAKSYIELTYLATNQHNAIFANGDVAVCTVATTDIPTGAKVTVELYPRRKNSGKQFFHNE